MRIQRSLPPSESRASPAGCRSCGAPVREGETVLVLGATGTVGFIALQAARLLGAGRVVAAGRSPEGLERAAHAGADATVAIGEGDFADQLREACGEDGPTLGESGYRNVTWWSGHAPFYERALLSPCSPSRRKKKTA